ncbi:MAG: hypothetical protein AAF725_12065 [Acidobacteriota bacterium]
MMRRQPARTAARALSLATARTLGLFALGFGALGLWALAAAPLGAEETAAEPETYTNTIKWATASEVDNFGFDVFRAEAEDGPFTRLTADPVEGAGTVDEPQRYEFVDDTIDPKKAYFYYVESISMSGVRERFTPVVRVKPKLEADAPREEPEADEECDCD